MANERMTSTILAATHLSDRQLLNATVRAASEEQRTTAKLIALLAELDTRNLYLGAGYSSLFAYCTQKLHISEPAAYVRIAAARASRRIPQLLPRLAAGEITLTTVTLLAPHLTDENQEALLEAVRHASKRDVERIVASLHAPPDLPALVRRMPTAASRGADEQRPVGSTPVLGSRPSTNEGTAETEAAGPAVHAAGEATAASLPRLGEHGADTGRNGESPGLSAIPASPAQPAAPLRRQAVAPLAADRYLLRVTIDDATHAKLERARDLLRHVIPTGDVSAILDRALTVLVDQLERRKLGRAARPSTARSGEARARGRHIPRAVRRVVWTRDQGRCAFIGTDGRCRETGFLEYHHVVPFAAGGDAEPGNIELRCRAHNGYEATVYFSDKIAPAAGASG
jgi:hypothetical protein